MALETCRTHPRRQSPVTNSSQMSNTSGRLAWLSVRRGDKAKTVTAEQGSIARSRLLTVSQTLRIHQICRPQSTDPPRSLPWCMCHPMVARALVAQTNCPRHTVSTPSCMQRPRPTCLLPVPVICCCSHWTCSCQACQLCPASCGTQHYFLACQFPSPTDFDN